MHTNAAAAQAQINAIHGKTVTVNVVLNITGGGGGGHGLSEQQVKHVTQQVETKLLRQAKRSGRTGLTLSGYGS